MAYADSLSIMTFDDLICMEKSFLTIYENSNDEKNKKPVHEGYKRHSERLKLNMIRQTNKVL